MLYKISTQCVVSSLSFFDSVSNKGSSQKASRTHCREIVTWLSKRHVQPAIHAVPVHITLPLTDNRTIVMSMYNVVQYATAHEHIINVHMFPVLQWQLEDAEAAFQYAPKMANGCSDVRLQITPSLSTSDKGTMSALSYEYVGYNPINAMLGVLILHC
jgi:hypothetical protein